MIIVSEKLDAEGPLMLTSITLKIFSTIVLMEIACTLSTCLQML